MSTKKKHEKRRALMEAALFEPLNGHAKTVEKAIKVFKERRSGAEKLRGKCDEEIERCDEGIRSLRHLLGQGDVPEALVEAVGDRGPLEEATKPDRRVTEALLGVTTGIHVKQVIEGYIQDMRPSQTFTTTDIRNRLYSSDEYPNLITSQVTRLLKGLHDEGVLKRSGKIWTKAKRRSITSQKSSSKVTTSAKSKKSVPKGKKSNPPVYKGEVGALLIEVISELPNKNTGFTQKDVRDQLEIEAKMFSNAMNHLRVRGHIKSGYYDEQQNCQTYTANW